MAALAAAGGCGSSGPATPARNAPEFSGVRVAVAAVGDAALLPTVSAQRGEWEASRGGTCAVLDNAVTPAETAGAQVLVFRADRLGDLVDAGALAVLPESVVRPAPRPETPDGGEEEDDREGSPDAPGNDPLQFDDVLPAYREQVSRYGRDRMALPYGGSAVVLAFHRTAFEREENLAAAKQAGLTLTPPTTWEQLDALARFFHGRDWDGDGTPDAGIALALGADPEGVGDAAFLARAAALGQHRDHYSLLFDADTMAPRLTTPPFVEALEGLVALKKAGPEGAEGFSAAAAREAFRQGKAALLIDRAEKAAEWTGPKGRAVGAAPLPGSGKVYEPSRKVWEPVGTPNRPSYLPFGGGWLVGLAAGATGRERDAALDLIVYLVNPETSVRVRSDPQFPMLAVRGSQLHQGLPGVPPTSGLEMRPWSDAVAKTLGAARVLPGLRIPGADGYLADLGAGRAAAAKGEPAEAALKKVSEAWAARTSRLGVERQVWHYRRSLNALVTTPKPPPRGGG